MIFYLPFLESNPGQLFFCIIKFGREYAFNGFFHRFLQWLTGNIESAEALVRWKHSKHGIIPPNEFIPMAERTGVIKDISNRFSQKGVMMKKIIAILMGFFQEVSFV